MFAIATGPPMGDPAATDEQRAYIRQRGVSVILGAATAAALTQFLPPIGRLGLSAIPLGRMLLTARYRRRRGATASSAP